MRFLFIVLALLIAAPLHAQSASQPKPAKYETLIGSTKQPPLKVEPAMQPAGATEQREAVAIPMQAAAPPIQTDGGRNWSSIEIVLTVGILAFTLIVLGMVVFLARRAQKAWSPQSILRVFGITLIIPLGVLLVVAGYSEKQIASVIGLLGVIAGYLLGNGERSRDSA